MTHLNFNAWTYPQHAPAGLDNEALAAFTELSAMMRAWLTTGAEAGNRGRVGHIEAQRIVRLINEIDVDHKTVIKHIGWAVNASNGERGLLSMRISDAMTWEGARFAA